MSQKGMSKIQLTEQDIKEMVVSAVQQILEGTNYDTLYHFTHFSSLLDIIKYNKFVLNDKQRYMRNGNNFMSLTRHKSFYEGFAYPSRCGIRIEFDMKKLNSLHSISKIYPFEYYSPKRLKNQFQGSSAKDAHMKLRNDSEWNNQWRDIEYYSQAEESLESYSDLIYEITDLVKYIKRIDVFDSDEEDIKNLLKFCKTYNRDYLKLIYIYSGESDYSHQTSNCVPLKEFDRNDCFRLQDLKKNSVSEQKEQYDILYRGVNSKQDNNATCVWLTTSYEYASLYGNVKEYKLSIPNVLDRLANEKTALKYLLIDTDEYPFYETEYFDIEKMKNDGYTGYYYHEDEYKCLNVCLFK